MFEHRVRRGEQRGLLKSAKHGADRQTPHPILPAGISVADVEAELRKITGSKAFAQAERLQRFLEFTVDWALAGRREQLKEFVIAVEVYGRKDSFDPKKNSIVRVEAGRLRSRLKEYYDTEGQDSALRIELPKGSYVPVFRAVAAKEAEPPETASLAVLPFVNMTANPENEYLSDGLTEELISALTRIDGLRVIGRTSVFQFKGKAADAREVGARLNVRALLDGSVRKAGDRLRITVQLISVSDGCQLWSQRYECEMKDVFAVQDEITGMVVDALRVRLTLVGARASSPAPNANAYHLYLKGRHQQTRRTPEGLHKSIANFQEAITLDPAFVAAYCGLSESYSIMAYNELLPPRELMPKAKAAAQYVVALDETLATAHALLGDVMSVYEWDWEGGEKEFRRATQLNPGDALAHYLYATSNLGPRGRWQEALEEMHRALQLDPVSPAMNRDLGQLLFMQRNYDQAIEQFHRTRDLDPDFIGVYYWQGRAYEQKSMPEQALAAFEQRLLRSKNTRVLAAIAHLHAASGDRAEALARLKELRQAYDDGRVPALDLAAVYVGLGETDRALEFLERAFEERSAAIYQLKVDPLYDPLRGEARFTTLLMKMGLDR